MIDVEHTSEAREHVQQAYENVLRVILGKDRVVQLLFAAMLADGHVLIEDVPGVGKTTLVRAIAQSFGCTFKRIQFTPDLLPTDVTGVSVYDQESGRFLFRPGPIMANIVLADEINRTSPKTQAALLEAMEERAVTVDGERHPLPDPFLVMATQNPIEYEGTFPLPEAQLDRFLIKVHLGYLSREEEIRLLREWQDRVSPEALQPVATAQHLRSARSEVQQVYVEESLQRAIVAFVQSTRELSVVALGASPRASLGWMRLAQASAYLAGRSYVTPEDLQPLAVPILAHRLVLTPQARMDGVKAESLVEELVAKWPSAMRRGAR